MYAGLTYVTVVYTPVLEIVVIGDFYKLKVVCISNF